MVLARRLAVQAGYGIGVTVIWNQEEFWLTLPVGHGIDIVYIALFSATLPIEEPRNKQSCDVLCELFVISGLAASSQIWVRCVS